MAMVELILRWCVLVPIVVTLVLLLPTLKPWRRNLADVVVRDTGTDARLVGSGGGWMMPIVLAVVAVLTHFGIRENWQISFPPSDVKLYLAYFMPVVAVVVLFSDAKWSRWWMRLFFAALLYRYYFPLLLGKLLSANWSNSAAMIWLISLTTGAVLLTWALDQVARRCPTRPFVFVLGLHVALSAALFSLMGSLTSGYQLGGVATFLGVLFLLLLWKRDVGSMPVLGGLGIGVVFLLIGNGSEVYFFSYAVAPGVPLLLWLSVPILWWVATHFFAGALAARPWLRTLVLTLMVLVPMASAGMVVYRANLADAVESGDDYYDENDW